MEGQDLWARLRMHVQEGIFKKDPAPLLIEEKERDGAAQVTCKVPLGVRSIYWKFERKPTQFGFLKLQEIADGVVMIYQDGWWELHVIELKRTLDEAEWRKAKRQMQGAVVRALALGGVLNIQFGRMVCYTGYREENLTSRRNPNPALTKTLIGATSARAAAADAEEEEGWSECADFHRGEVELAVGIFAHRSIPLDSETGHGEIELGVEPEKRTPADLVQAASQSSK